MNPLPLQELVLSVKGLPRLARFLPKVVLALLVSASAEGYKKLAIWLNDMGTPCQGRSRCPGEGGPYCPAGPPAAFRGLGPPPHSPLRPPENYRLESAYEKHLIIKVVLVSGGQQAGSREAAGGVRGAPGDRAAERLPTLLTSHSSSLLTPT